MMATGSERLEERGELGLLQRARSWSYGSRVAGLLALGVAVLVVAVLLPPISQDPAYHGFADSRAFLGVPNFGDVASNIPFFLVGILGLVFLAKARAGPADPLAPAFFTYFVGVGLVAFGSAYYHYEPNNETLFWDRLPMSIAFMALFSAFISDRIHERVGRLLLVPLVVLGVASVVYWHVSEQAGAGDLRFYGVVQFFPMVALPLICVLFRPRRLDGRYVAAMIGFYALAKVFEFFDQATFELLGQAVSGHSLKHLAAAVAAYLVLPMLKQGLRASSSV
jgi:hypothetical protein